MNRAATLTVPLGSVRAGELFAVHVSLGGVAVDDRGGESGAQAFIQDPQQVGPALRANGLEPRGAPRFKEPPVSAATGRELPSWTEAACRHRAVQAPDVLGRRGRPHPDGAGHPHRRVARRGQRHRQDERRNGPLRDRLRAYPHTGALRERGHSPRLVEIPIREDRTVESAEDFTVSLSSAQCATLGQPRHATVTILDDDQPRRRPRPPPRSPSAAPSTGSMAAAWCSSTGARNCT